MLIGFSNRNIPPDPLSREPGGNQRLERLTDSLLLPVATTRSMASVAVFHPASPLPSRRRRRSATPVTPPLLRRRAPPHKPRNQLTAEFAVGGDAGGSADSPSEAGARRGKKIDVAAVAALLRGAKTADDVEFLLRDYQEMPVQVYTSVIRGLGKDKHLDAAFAVVEHLKRKRGSFGSSAGHNLFVFNCLLGAVKNSGKFERVGDVLADMEAQGVAPNIVTMNTLMSVYLEQGRIDEVFKVYAELHTLNLSPSLATYSTMLSAYKKTLDAFAALGFFVELRERYEKGEMANRQCDDWEHEFVKFEKLTVRICYMAMRQSLVNGENPGREVLKVLLAMDEARVRPSRADYERLVWACTGEEHYTIAKELYQRIHECDGEIRLSVCNHLIWLMGKARKWWAALEVYEDLLDKGPKPNHMSYELIMSHFNILLDAARRRGIWRWGVRLLEKMQEKGLKLETRQWNAVLLACSRAGESSAAVEIFRRMLDEGEKPNIVSYGALLSALEKGKLYNEALRVWEHMCKLGVKPNLYAYTILVSVYIGKGNPEMVDVVLREMLSSKIEPTVVTFNVIITGCVKNDMSGAAFEWFHRMKVLNIEPNEVTYQMLIEALAKDGKPRLAYEMYLRACNKGLQLPAKSYDVVMEACQAYGFLIDLATLGPRPAEKTDPIRIQKNASDLGHLENIPSKGKQFESTEICSSQR